MLLAGLCPQLLELCPVCSIGMYGCVGVSCTSEIEAQGWDVPEVTWWVGREATVQSTGLAFWGPVWLKPYVQLEMGIQDG